MLNVRVIQETELADLLALYRHLNTADAPLTCKRPVSTAREV